VVSLFSWSYWCVLLLGFGRPRRPQMRSGNNNSNSNSSSSGTAVAAMWRAYEWVTVENWGLVMLLSQAVNAGMVLVSCSVPHQSELREAECRGLCLCVLRWHSSTNRDALPSPSLDDPTYSLDSRRAARAPATSLSAE
jgi:hypothetical protein